MDLILNGVAFAAPYYLIVSGRKRMIINKAESHRERFNIAYNREYADIIAIQRRNKDLPPDEQAQLDDDQSSRCYDALEKQELEKLRYNLDIIRGNIDVTMLNAAQREAVKTEWDSDFWLSQDADAIAAEVDRFRVAEAPARSGDRADEADVERVHATAVGTGTNNESIQPDPIVDGGVHDLSESGPRKNRRS